MNHTIKSIILVVAIASMLVLGASIFPITQNSFASKKFDVKQADRNANTNINTNTNSADSTSSSSAIAGNTNNINNSACAVAVSTCPKGSIPTPIGISPPPQGTGTLDISKFCLTENDEEVSCGPIPQFPIKITGNNPQPSSFTFGQSPIHDDQSVILGPGSFTITETPQRGFDPPIFLGACKETSPLSFSATGTISAGQTLRCNIDNHFTTPPPP